MKRLWEITSKQHTFIKEMGRKEFKKKVRVRTTTLPGLVCKARLLMNAMMLLILPLAAICSAHAGWQVREFYQKLTTHASSRQTFLSTEPYDLPRPQKMREYKRIKFS